ncbi:MAG TPA: DUF3040 domain-containing protein [Pseudonocardiaceae bacterium]|jgi:cation transport ATPase|nr:DUF3040 domain-containing protein [Pseudonocardiaceae bacterium]
MTLSRDERRELAELNQLLSQESELAELAALFTDPPVRPQEPPARSVDPSRRQFAAVVVALVGVVVAVAGGCFLAASGEPAAMGAAVVLVVSAGVGLGVALIRYARG